VVSSELLYPEARAAAAAARRARRITDRGLRLAVYSIERMSRSVELVKVDRLLNRDAGELAERHGLRGSDAVHLATALRVPSRGLVVATWDRRLASAATANGVGVVPYAPLPQTVHA
jgi:uncharacterized protein